MGAPFQCSAAHGGTQLFAIGLNHQTAPLHVREQMVFNTESLEPALNNLMAQHSVQEAAIVSTCNRTEIYCRAAEPRTAIEWMANYHTLTPKQIEPYLYRLPRERAVRHAFRVASGLDSMVIGEPQILGQFKDAVRAAETAGTMGLLLNKLFQRTFAVAKSVRSETDIGASTVSMASAAVHLAGRIYPSIAGQSVLFVGAGEMIALCASHFAAHHPKHMTFANRTEERARQLAERYRGRAVSLDALPAQLASHDIIVCCTASPLPLFGKDVVERALVARKQWPLMIFDLAVPRDVESEVGELDGVFLYTVDDLGKIAAAGVAQRRNAAQQAEVMIENQVADFMHWLGNRDLVPTIRGLRDTAERARRHAVESALRKLDTGEDPRQVIETLSKALTNKLMHPPTHALNHAIAEERDLLANTLTRIYQLQ